MASEERRILESVCDAARSARRLTRAQWERLRSAFGDRFEKAWRLVEERRVKLYVFEPSGRTAWIVVGRGGEYQILPASGYCSCNDFYYRVVDGGAGVCYHLIGQRLADALGAYDEVHEGDEFFDALMAEWRRAPPEEPAREGGGRG
ncbi:hypothetical protein DRO42_06530 [Candidatus Bathyarchaeota archaeon]|nr:MAG: hypothetical protein DRO42_06530 [Candidatus Bathyarchaeota archaeon]